MFREGAQVIFEEFIPYKSEMNEEKRMVKVEGTGVFAQPAYGTFHCWGLDYDDGASFTVAIVERADGSIATVNTDKVKFIR